MAWYDALTSGAGLDALGLGVGAAGTGFGVWDLVNANQQARNRDFQARHWPMQHPVGSYMPQLNDAVRAAMARPSASNMATAGLDPSGGAFTQGITDSLSKQYTDIYNMSEQQRLADFQAYLQSLGQPRQAMGSVAGLPQALQWMQVARALRQPQQQAAPGAADTTNLPGMELYGPSSSLGRELQTSWPQGDVSGGKFGGQYPSFYPDYATDYQ